MNAFLERLVDIERSRFSVNEYRGLEDAPAFMLVEGDMPAIVSAPHAVTHVRAGRIKASEDFTGPIAIELARATGAHCIVATRFDEADPNADDQGESAYKQALAAHVEQHGIMLVVDVHGMATASPAIIAVGTGEGRNVSARPEVADRAMEIVEAHLAPFALKHGKAIVRDGRYAARDANTVAATIARTCGVAALQVELSTLLRFPGGIAGRTPPGEKNPFPASAIGPELSARRNPDTAAVEAAFAALSQILRLAET